MASNGRTCYNKFQNGEADHKKITDELIQRLEEAGFKWSLRRSKFDDSFEES